MKKGLKFVGIVALALTVAGLGSWIWGTTTYMVALNDGFEATKTMGPIDLMKWRYFDGASNYDAAALAQSGDIMVGSFFNILIAMIIAAAFWKAGAFFAGKLPEKVQFWKRPEVVVDNTTSEVSEQPAAAPAVTTKKVSAKSDA